MGEYMFLLAVPEGKASDECLNERNTNGFGFSGSSSQRHLSFIWHCCWDIDKSFY
jgi:hypothetical protein